MKLLIGKPSRWVAATVVFGVATVAQIVGNPDFASGGWADWGSWLKPERIGILITAAVSGISAMGAIAALMNPAAAKKQAAAIAAKAETLPEAVDHEGAAGGQATWKSQNTRRADLAELMQLILDRTNPQDAPADAQNAEERISAVERAAAEGGADLEALRKIAAGDAPGGFNDLAAHARQVEAEGPSLAAQTWRDLGALAFCVDTARARDAYAEAARLDPDNVWTQTCLSRIHQTMGDLMAAQAAAERAADAAMTDRERAATLADLGDVLTKRGDLAGAQDKYGKSLEIGVRLAKADPASEAVLRDVSISVERLGDVLRAQGDFAGAHDNYAKSLQIAEHLAIAEPASANAQRDLSVLLSKIGDVLRTCGDLSGAESRYVKSLKITSRLAKADPASPQAQRDLSVCLKNLGQVLVDRGDLAGAQDRYAQGLEIDQRLATADPASADAQRDLSVTLEKLGHVLGAQGDPAAAQDLYRHSLDIRQRLAAADPGSQGAQRDLAASLMNLGDVLNAQRDHAAAQVQLYQKSFEIFERLAKADPASAEAQRNLAIGHNKLGDAFHARGDIAATQERYERSLQITERLAQADPASVEAQRDLIVSYVKMQAVTGDRAWAAKALNLGREMEARGLLAPADAWMIQDLEDRAGEA